MKPTLKYLRQLKLVIEKNDAFLTKFSTFLNPENKSNQAIRAPTSKYWTRMYRYKLGANKPV